MSQSYEYVIIGAGVIGLTLARELTQLKCRRILEKETNVGEHASGRNSGVIHAGLYYAHDSLKAQLCAEGAKRLINYCEERHLPILKCGKVIVASTPAQVPVLKTLLERTSANGVEAKKISLAELKELEPEARSLSHAIWSPNTAVVDPRIVMQSLLREVQKLGVTVRFGEEVQKVDLHRGMLSTQTGHYKYALVYNTAGTQADKIAHKFGVGLDYSSVPFRGVYYRASEGYAKKIQRLIYPAPDIHLPFLGVHILRTVGGKVLFGPTAMPALGRENYSGLKNINLQDGPKIAWNLTKMMAKNPDGFRDFTLKEISNTGAKSFHANAARLVQRLSPSDIGPLHKVGIRAQLMNKSAGRLEMDFVVEKGPRSFHVLNALSPAFTSSFAFASYLINESHK